MRDVEEERKGSWKVASGGKGTTVVKENVDDETSEIETRDWTTLKMRQARLSLIDAGSLAGVRSAAGAASPAGRVLTGCR